MSRSNEKGEMYSLWLMPCGQTALRLQRLITRLSKEYSAPAFQPHVTLIGGINMPETAAMDKTSELAAHVSPFKIRLSGVTHLDQYFRCVFIKACKTQALLNAHSAARAAFGKEGDAEYMPHLSLLYGDLNPRTREQISRDLGCSMEVAFMAEELFLYYTEGQTEKWYCVTKKPLTGVP